MTIAAMRGIGFLALMLGAAALPGCGGPARATERAGTQADSVLRAEVTAFERSWGAAADARDRARLDSLIAPEWTITLADGRRSDKRRALAHWTAPPAAGVLRDTSILDSVEVRPLGPDAAVALAAITDIEVRAGGAGTTRTRVTDVLVRRGGRWQVLVSHESVLLPDSAAHAP